MGTKQASIAKITAPNITRVVPRTRLFERMDRALERPMLWVAAPAGSGKTTLVKSYLDARKIPCLWYQVDAGDGDAATFFYYMGLAARKAAPRSRMPLPLLTPEYLSGLSTFTRRYFEGLFGRLTPPYAVVLDNYQEAPEGSAFHEVMRDGLSVVPEGVKVIALSRSSVPTALARLQAGGMMDALGWDDIRFMPDEVKQLFRMRGLAEPPDKVLQDVQARTEGWAAGLVLLMEAFKAKGGVSELPGNPAQQEIFNYFAGEIFDKTDEETRDLLLKTAFLPALPLRAARSLTGNSRTDEILDGLYRKYYFTERHSSEAALYQYHPLFREFLIVRAKSLYPAAVVAGIQRQSAVLLEEAGRVEDAAGLYFDARDWGGLVRLIENHARSLVMQGRAGTLAEWLAAVPGEIMDRNPWLVYWLGISRMHHDLRASRADLERAFGLFKKQNDTAGLYLSWSGIIDTFVYEWSDFAPVDRWIEEIEALLKERPVFPSREIETRVASGIFAALMYRQPHHPDISRWEERARTLILESGDVQLKAAVSSHLVLYYTWWTGEQARAEMLINTHKQASQGPEISPLSTVVWRAIEAAYHWMTAGNEACLEAVRKGFETADASGVHLWDFMLGAQASFGTLTAGRLEEAGKYLRNMSFILHTKRRLDIAHYHYHLGWEAICHENLSLAREHMELSVKTSHEAGVPFILAFTTMGLAEVLIEYGDYWEAERLLNEARGLGQGMKSMTVEYQYSWIEAFRLIRQGNEKAAMEHLRRHLAISREYRILNHACWRSSVMTQLYAKALEAGIETEHVRFMIRKRALAPPDAIAGYGAPSPRRGEGGGEGAIRNLTLENWPWDLKIYALGGFELEKNGQPFEYPGRTPQKLLALLKLLIIAGEKGVSELQISEALWPEAEGDAAHSAFTTSLQRLRNLIGEAAVRHQAGVASLDRRRCWVDAWEFEGMLESAEFGVRNVEQADRVGVRDGNAVALVQNEKLPLPGGKRAGVRGKPELLQRFEKALQLYSGDFLGREEIPAWALLYRERLRIRFHKCARKLAGFHEKNGNWKTALDLYEHGLDVDDLSEEFYQGYMECCRKLGRRAEGIAAYRRCAAALSARLGIEPSAETEAVYQALLKD